MTKKVSLKEIYSSNQLGLIQNNCPPAPQDDRLETWWQIVDSWKDGYFSLPAHQREPNRWSKVKQKFWILRLASAIPPIGCILVYQKENEIPVYLNDGLQRLTAALNLLDFPEEFGFTAEAAKILLKERKITVQKRVYSSHEQAMVDFQFANLGSLMSPKEFYHGVLAYVNGYDTQWKDLIDQFHNHVNLAASRILSKKALQSRNIPTRHRHQRHDYVLIWKFLTNHKGTRRWSLMTRPMNAEDLLKKDAIEFALAELLEVMPISKVQKGFEALQRLIDNETALFKEIWERVRPKKGAGLSASAYRWLLDVAVWRKFNKVPHLIWEDFIESVLIHCQGKCQLTSGKPGEVVNLSVGQPGRLVPVCEVIGHNMIEYVRGHKRKCQSMEPEPGLDISHELPFVEYGEGPVVLEPAGRNRARGAQPISTST